MRVQRVLMPDSEAESWTVLGAAAAMPSSAGQSRPGSSPEASPAGRSVPGP